MKKPEKRLVHLVAVIGFLVLIMGSCKKDNTNPVNQTNGKTTAQFNPNLKYGTLTDQDGNVYKTITIGTQTWMAENLRTTKYRNGDKIINIKKNDTWMSTKTGAYCNYNNTDNIDTIATFGRLYNWYAISDSRKIAPKGWRVATDDDWTLLITYLGRGDKIIGDSIAGAYLKETGNTHWIYSEYVNPAVDNSSGFTAIPAYWRTMNGSFAISRNAFFWTSSSTNKRIWFHELIDGFPFVLRADYLNKNFGMSVRCVKE